MYRMYLNVMETRQELVTNKEAHKYKVVYGGISIIESLNYISAIKLIYIPKRRSELYSYASLSFLKSTSE